MDFARVERAYRRVRVPVLLLWGREAAATPLAIGERRVSELPDATLRVYPRCGHFPMIEAAPASTRDLGAFLREEASR
jgi:pimeloyl-ACP methyl ester carboxylesterase